jgi:uncharacterized protein YfaS (alpha-2-macroglobulin family)
MASTRDPHGNLVTASRYSEYAGENGRPPPDASADVSTDKASYEAGDTVHVGLWSSHPRAAGVLIVEAEGQPARVHGFQIADHTARVNVPTTPAFARRLRLRARIYDPQTFEVSTSDVAVRVLPSAAAIAVRVTMGKGPYLQGEPLDVEASLTDGAGNAVEGNVLVLLADEQIWRATQYAVPDWTTAIWGAVERGYLAQHFGCRDTRWSTSSSSPEPRRVLPLVTTGLAGLKGSTVVSGPFPTHGGATRIAVTLPAHPGVYRTLAIAVADRFRTGTHEGQIDVTSSSIVETSPPR